MDVFTRRNETFLFCFACISCLIFTFFWEGGACFVYVCVCLQLLFCSLFNFVSKNVLLFFYYHFFGQCWIYKIRTVFYTFI